MGRTVVVTGVSGYVGTRLLRLLEEDDAVDRVIGVDTVDPPLRTPNLEFHTGDVRDPHLVTLFEGADTVVHLAFVLEAMHDAELMREVNVGGFRNVLAAVAEAGVDKLVYMSSVYAYGAHPDNDVPLTEESPLRPNFGFAYAEQKAETEAILEQWMSSHGDVAVTVLRPAIVLGAGVDNFMSRTLESPLYVGVKGHAPDLQVLHQDDAASAVHHFTVNDLPGVHNISADGALSRADLLGLLGRRQVSLPEDAVLPFTDVSWKVGLADQAPGSVNYLMYPFVMANDKARSAGWAPGRSNVDTVAETVEAHAEWVSLGPFRARRSDVRRNVRNLVIAAIVGGVVTALGLRRLLRPR